MVALSMSRQTRRVLAFFADEPEREFDGLQVSNALGVLLGTLTISLYRLEYGGWLTSRWEEREPDEPDLPRRRLYRLAPGRTGAARAVLARAQAGPRRPWWLPRSRPSRS